MLRLVAILCAVGLLAAAGAGWMSHHLLSAPDASASGEAAEQIVVVPRGASLIRICNELETKGLIRNARVVVLFARAKGIANQLRAGEYALTPSLSAASVLERLTTGQVKTYEVSIPEGLRATEIAVRLEASGLVDADAFLAFVLNPEAARSLDLEGDSLEGYLFPETYRLARGLSAEFVARTMVAEFRRAWSIVAPLAHDRGMSMREVVTLASVVEKETGAAVERPIIASVFHNRLNRKMRLESDPTVIYGIADFDGNIKKRHLLDSSNLYNTYRHSGLTPGPIANPGLEALRAVVDPADSEYLYFVSMNDGTHKFSRTYREHVNAVNRYQKRRRSK